jgi:hypothetical protein
LAASRVPLALWKGAGKSIEIPAWFGTYEVLLAGVLGIVLAVFSLMPCKITNGSNKGFAIGYVIGLVGTKSVWFASLGGVVTAVGTGVSIGAFLTFGAGVGLTFAVIYILGSWAVYGLFLFVRRIGLLGPQDLWHSA